MSVSGICVRCLFLVSGVCYGVYSDVYSDVCERCLCLASVSGVYSCVYSGVCISGRFQQDKLIFLPFLHITDFPPYMCDKYEVYFNMQ